MSEMNGFGDTVDRSHPQPLVFFCRFSEEVRKMMGTSRVEDRI